MAVTPNLGLASPLAAAVSGWIARLKADLNLIDQAFGGLAGSGVNLLVNPGFDVNQRGLASYTGNLTYTLDRWSISYDGAVSLVASRDATVFDALGNTSAKCVFSKGGGTAATLEQLVEAGPTLKGATVTFRLRVKCSVAGAARAVVSDGITQSFSEYHTGGGGWETLAVTKALSGVATLLKVGGHLGASCTAYLDNATLVLGSTGLPYAPLTNGENLRRCQRYYEVQGGAVGHPLVHGYAGAGGEDWFASHTWAVPKGAAPTVSLLGTWLLTNSASIAVSAANANGYALHIVSSAAGSYGGEPNSGDDVIVAEWNP